MAPMRLTRTFSYDAPTAEVVTMMQDPAFWDRVAEATGALSSSTTVTTRGGAIEVVSDQQQAVAGVPAFAKRFVGESTQAIITAAWDGDRASYVVKTPGKPTTIEGTVAVSGSGTGSGAVVTYDLDVKASVPLVGGKLEKLVCDLTGDGFEKEHAVGVAWLGR